MTMDTWNEAMLDPDSDSLDLSSLNGSFDLNSTLAYTYSKFGQNPYPLLILQNNEATFQYLNTWEGKLSDQIL